MYELSEQTSLDIHWYFRDQWARLCVALSGGGFLPPRVAANDEANDTFHELVLKLKRRYETRTNERALRQVEGLGDNGLKNYLAAVEPFAQRGLYVFDKHRLSDPTDPYYLLVVAPVYDADVDPYPVSPEALSLLPRMRGAINPNSIRPVNLTRYLQG